MKLVFEKSVPGRTGVLPGPSDVPGTIHIRESLLREKPAAMPELSEMDVIRHFTELSRRNYGVDTNFYPLGSCTMKYNPKVCERIAAYPGFAHLHPLLPQLRRGGMLTQGALAILYEMDLLLREITGMAGFTMQPLAGAHGELTGMMIMAAYHRDRGNKKSVVLAPDSAHGTNPASAAIAGYRVVTIPSTEQGVMDMDALKRELNDEVAGIMLTSPNTLGLFNSRIHEICDLIHSVDGLAYYDGANLNAIVGKARPGDFGFDIVHLNLHKTFATPHGGGGPGAGPVGVAPALVPFLPRPVVERDGDRFRLDHDRPQSIGKMRSFFGNYGILIRAFTYVLEMGGAGLTQATEMAVLNANYVRAKLGDIYPPSHPHEATLHECVLTGVPLKKETGASTLHVAKRLMDHGFHPPTVYFPLIVHEALMIEPTESEPPEEIDRFIGAMRFIAAEAKENPELVQSAPHLTGLRRLDETRAARKPRLRYTPPETK